MTENEPRPPGRLAAARLALFLLTGAALPFFAFPVAHFFGKPVDLATICAGAFVAASVFALARSSTRATRLFLLLAAIVPLAALVGAGTAIASHRQFAISYAHWLLVTFFFGAATVLPASRRTARSFVRVEWAVGILVALYAIYQAVGIPRGWPATGPVLIGGQREPFRFTWIGGTYLGGGYTRPTSIFLEPAWMGGYLCWIIAVALHFVGTDTIRRGRGRVALAVVALGIPTIAVLATVSWGAYVDLAAVLLASAVVFSTQRTRSRASLAGIPIAMVLALGILLTPIGAPLRSAIATRWNLLRSTSPSSRTGEAARDSSWVRVQNLRYAMRLAEDHPATGVGLGQFGLVSRADDVAAPVRDPWCGWMAIAAELGLAGPALLAFAIVLAGVRRTHSDSSSIAGVAPVLALLAAVQQTHTGSYIDLWWWYPLSAAAFLKRTG